jgi:hypothetical protein
MNRLHTLSFALIALALATVITGCRGNLSGLPSASPAFFDQSAASSDDALGPKLSERPMIPLHGSVGSSNVATADPPIARPDTTPCVVTLFERKVFKNFSDQTFPFKPPAQCPGPWAKVVFNFDLRVTKGVQYDRTGIMWVDGAVIYFGTTAEPTNTLAPHWHVERDVTDLSALFTQPSKGQVELWNCYCPPTYNGFQVGKAYVQFYPADSKYPAPHVPDEVLGVPYEPPLGGVATLPKSKMELMTTLPTNIDQAYLDVFLQSQAKEEQWFMCAPDDVWQESHRGIGFCRNSAFREGEVSVNGQPAGVAPIYPWIYTGGMDPDLWVPMPGVQTLDFVPFRVDLTPFAGVLSNGSPQTLDVSVFRAFDNFSGAGDLLLYLDHKSSTVTGAVTQDTLRAQPNVYIESNVTVGSGAGVFGGLTGHGTVSVRSHTNYTISGYANTSAGKVTTTVTGSGVFTNKQRYDYTSTRYVELTTQNTHFDTTTTTQTGTTQGSVSSSFTYPLTVSYPFLKTSTGFKLPIEVYQGYRADMSGSGKMPTETTNTVDGKDTMIFNSSGQWIGVRNGVSVQLYTYKSKRPTDCYGKQLESKNNVLTAISKPGCNAQLPVRKPPRI